MQLKRVQLHHRKHPGTAGHRGSCTVQHAQPVNALLPEWFESEKTSPHHRAHVSAQCTHFPHRYEASLRLTIVQV